MIEGKAVDWMKKTSNEQYQAYAPTKL